MDGAAADDCSDFPDFAHPLKFRQAEAKWKRGVSLAHSQFCLCGDFLSHFKWPSGRGAGGDPDDHAGGVDESTSTGGGDITGHTGDGEGDISDLELLQ
nr:ORF2 [Torque teno Leptonychotes weddellii virus 1]